MSTTTPAAPPTTMGLPTTIGLIVALAGPFLVQFVLAPLIVQSPLRSDHRGAAQPVHAVAAGRHGDRHHPRVGAQTLVLARPSPHLVASGAAGIVVGVVLVFAVAALTVAVNRLMPPTDGGTVESVAAARRPGCSWSWC